MNPELKRICNEIYEHLGIKDPTPPPVDPATQKDFVVTFVEDPVDVLRESDTDNQPERPPNPVHIDDVEIQTTRQIIHRCRSSLAEGTFSELGVDAVAKYDRILAQFIESFIPPEGWQWSNDPTIASSMCISVGKYATKYRDALVAQDNNRAAKYAAITAMHVTRLILSCPESHALGLDTDIEPEEKN